MIRLHFWDGYSNKMNYEKYLSLVPDRFSDYIDILVPNPTGELKTDGSFSWSFKSPQIPSHLVNLGRSKGAMVLPMVLGSGKTANQMLADAEKRHNFVNSSEKAVRESMADGIFIDLEGLAPDTGSMLTELMKEIYNRLHPQGKILMAAVMSRTSDSAEPWNRQYNYSDLARYTDYLQIMSYDFHYATSEPGPIAPLAWVDRVMAYAVTRIPSRKILMGIPCYGRSWTRNGSTWKSKALSLAAATQTADRYGATVTRKTTPTDPVGIPSFKYIDENGVPWTAWYDDHPSWKTKLDLIHKYDLGGMGAWSMSWINGAWAAEYYSLLKQI